MTYDQTREEEQWRLLGVDIESFIRRHQSISPARRRTLFLFPGGLGSQLFRAKTPYLDSGPAVQRFDYELVWLDLGTLLGDAFEIRMHKSGNDYRDLGNRIVIPNGITNLFNLSPYGRFLYWCQDNDIDCFVVAWDWRRRLEETVHFFLNTFLPRFRSIVRRRTGADPLDNFFLVGHSSGGNVVTLIMQERSTLLDSTRLKAAITVATPFYGYHGQIQRWFEGHKDFNLLLGRMDIIRLLTTLPGLYVFPYLDLDTYRNLESAGLPPVNAYPCTDRITTDELDPYSPGTDRYPENTGFMGGELQHALCTYRRFAAGPPRRRRRKFFNMYGVQSLGTTIKKKTVGSLSWKLLQVPLDPGNSPIVLGPKGAGDDTQPQWTAQLVDLPADQRIKVGGDIDHTFMMENDRTHAKLAALIGRVDP